MNVLSCQIARTVRPGFDSQRSEYLNEEKIKNKYILFFSRSVCVRVCYYYYIDIIIIHNIYTYLNKLTESLKIIRMKYNIIVNIT